MRWVKGIFVILTASMFWGIWRFSLPIFKLAPPSILSESLEPSWFMKMNIHRPVLMVYAMLVMAGLVFFFACIQGGLPGNKGTKGFLYGLCFGGLWYIGFIGIAFYFNTPIIKESVSGLADAIPLLVAGWLSGLVLGENKKPIQLKPQKALFQIAIMALVYTLIHSSTYLFVDHDGINARILFIPTNGSQLTILVLLGAWLGVIFAFLRNGFPYRSRIKNVILFAAGVFGYNWFAFNLFYTLFFASILLPSIGVAILDVLAVFIGIVVIELFQAQKRGPLSVID
jgi:hypothetical protein